MMTIPSFRKQRATNENFVDLRQHVADYVTRAELDNLLDATVEKVKGETRGKRASFAWSGGKDSIVLAAVCSRAGIRDGVCVLTHLEYPAYLRWLSRRTPEGVVTCNTGQNLRWLARHPHMLFPQDSATTGQWFRIVQHRGQNRFAARHRLDVLLFGRRRSDGNYVGRGGSDRYVANGVVKYSPLADWSHAHVLAYAHYYQEELPPNYSWPRGFRVGTGPWAKRQGTGSVRNGWAELWTIDPDIVREAARLIPSARAYLATVRQ